MRRNITCSNYCNTKGCNMGRELQFVSVIFWESDENKVKIVCCKKNVILQESSYSFTSHVNLKGKRNMWIKL